LLNQKQYATSHNYDARLYLNSHFKTNPNSKAKWLFDLLPTKENQKILEAGCGTGLFWLANKDLIPKNWEITLSDYSEGMLKETQRVLNKVEHPFKYIIIDAQDIGYPDKQFDIVLANNMIYHLKEKAIAFYHIKRILKEDGAFIASTQGMNDMKELNKLLYSFLGSKGKHHFVFKERSFSMENGLNQLKPFFSNIKLKTFMNLLTITEVEPIIQYFLSFNGMVDNMVVLPKERINDFREYLQGILNKEKSISASKESGAFICTK
jgi:ubiquinone/menaquinone biosynthesis C-methylase UbiE